MLQQLTVEVISVSDRVFHRFRRDPYLQVPRVEDQARRERIHQETFGGGRRPLLSRGRKLQRENSHLRRKNVSIGSVKEQLEESTSGLTVLPAMSPFFTPGNLRTTLPPSLSSRSSTKAMLPNSFIFLRLMKS
jgi:hypothetical protein